MSKKLDSNAKNLVTQNAQSAVLDTWHILMSSAEGLYEELPPFKIEQVWQGMT